MYAAKIRTQGDSLEIRHVDLLRKGAKLTQASRQLISDAKRLLATSAELISSSKQRRKISPR